MKTLNQGISEISFHLQSLAAPEFYPEVQDAVEKKDKDSLVRVCRKAKIPARYLATVVSMLLSMSVEQPKWPAIV